MHIHLLFWGSRSSCVFVYLCLQDQHIVAAGRGGRCAGVAHDETWGVHGLETVMGQSLLQGTRHSLWARHWWYLWWCVWLWLQWYLVLARWLLLSMRRRAWLSWAIHNRCSLAGDWCGQLCRRQSTVWRQGWNIQKYQTMNFKFKLLQDIYYHLFHWSV